METFFAESAVARAIKGTIVAAKSVRFWIFQLCVGAFITVWALLHQPWWLQEGTWTIVYQVLLPPIGVLSGLVIVWTITFALTPFRQRDEARQQLADSLAKRPHLVLHGKPRIEFLPHPDDDEAVLPNFTFPFMNIGGADAKDLTSTIVLAHLPDLDHLSKTGPRELADRLEQNEVAEFGVAVRPNILKIKLVEFKPLSMAQAAVVRRLPIAPMTTGDSLAILLTIRYKDQNQLDYVLTRDFRFNLGRQDLELLKPEWLTKIEAALKARSGPEDLDSPAPQPVH